MSKAVDPQILQMLLLFLTLRDLSVSLKFTTNIF